jgi:hypothetical protein
MLFKRRHIFIILAISLVFSFAGGYYLTLRHSNQFNKDNPRVAAETTLLPTNTVVSQSTRIIKRYRYSTGMGYIKDLEEKPTADILGMDKKSVDAYYKKLGYTLVDFTSKEVLVVKDMQLWPPGCIVVKESNGAVAVYDVDEDGNLKLKETTYILLEYLPEQDRNEVVKGKIYEDIEKVKELLEEYDS